MMTNLNCYRKLISTMTFHLSNVQLLKITNISLPNPTMKKQHSRDMTICLGITTTSSRHEIGVENGCVCNTLNDTAMNCILDTGF